METYGSPYLVGLNPTRYQLKNMSSNDNTSNEDITPLHVSVFHKKNDFIDRLIGSYEMNVNSQDLYGDTSLIVSSQIGNLEATQKLLKYNADKNILNRHGQTALFVALRFNHADVALELLSSMAGSEEWLNITDNLGYTILHYASFTNSLEVLDKLEQSCFIDQMVTNTTNPACCTPLHIAAANGNDLVVQWLLNKGASCETENCMGQSPLLLAIKYNHLSTINILLPLSTPNIPDNYGQLALHYAAAVGLPLEVLRAISSAYPQAVNKMDTNGNFPFHHAVKSDSLDVLQFFFQSLNVQLNTTTSSANLLVKKNSNGMTPLMLAAALGNMKSFSYIKRLGGDIYASTMSGSTPFLLSCAYGRLKMAQSLFMEDPSVLSDVDHSGNTAVHYAVQNNRVEVLNWLKTVGGNLIKKGNEIGETPLHLACLCGYKGIIESLTFALSMTDVTVSGRTPFHYAVLGGHLGVVKQARHSAEMACFAADKNRLTPLHYCAMNGMVHLVNELLAACPALLNARDGCGRTPLHIAVVCDDAVMVKRLLEHGADVNQLDIRKMTAGQSAINRGFVHCYELINGQKEFTVLKRVRMVSEFQMTDDNLLSLEINNVVDVFWENKKGWALGQSHGKYGLFPLAKGVTLPLEKDEQKKIGVVLEGKKMVKKNVDRNRSMSVFKQEKNDAKNVEEKITNLDPQLLVKLQKQQAGGAPKKRRGGVPSVDV
ncbi:ankyrin repeat-containing protein, putative [Entamoeba invadens IP1]|uniref:Ankyrin repeat-containing protein, putative n=1 Tax=Entamoeba invadens IP1 TaxID=370355 RepID=A0A0A1UGD8_ENTIV|nr:ankyrin repeat-containing protein, putative [Entamoeba invadens IP1]ELP92586.1 ankyrin repeat-containing protein, putative [Entamoeba invadens IP1]|eukprot:XP_004259357.1 ankyrin repeat-containing protein, putative [Entamoeba invadens IP1]